MVQPEAKNQYIKVKEYRYAYFPYEYSPGVLLGFLFLSFKCQLRNSCHFHLYFRLTERKWQMEDKYLRVPKKLLFTVLFSYLAYSETISTS